MTRHTSRFGRIVAAGIWLAAILAVAAPCPLLVSGCGGGGSQTTPKKKKKKPKGDGGREKAPAGLAEEDPTVAEPPSAELKTLVKGLAAKDEGHWQSAQEKITALGEGAIPGLNWGLQFPLQNLRARACNILSRMQKSEKMIPGALAALKMYPDDVTPHEAGIRRWAAYVLCCLPSVHTETPMRNGADKDKDLAVKAFLAAGVSKLGIPPFPAADLLRGLGVEDAACAGLIAQQVEAVYPHSGFKAEGFGDLPQEQRAAKVEELLAWWKANSGKTKPLTADKNYDPWPQNVGIYVGPPEEPVDFDDEHEVEQWTKDAEEALAQGDKRKAAANYREAFRWSKHQRVDLALKHHEVWRQLGPDNAEKSYEYLHSKLIPRWPLNEDLWMAAARSGLASGGTPGKKMAEGDLRMVLLLVPEHAEAKAMMAEIGGTAD